MRSPDCHPTNVFFLIDSHAVFGTRDLHLNSFVCRTQKGSATDMNPLYFIVVSLVTISECYSTYSFVRYCLDTYRASILAENGNVYMIEVNRRAYLFVFLSCSILAYCFLFTIVILINEIIIFPLALRLRQFPQQPLPTRRRRRRQNQQQIENIGPADAGNKQ